MSSPASPSGNRHDGVELSWAVDGGGDWWYVDATANNPATHIAYPVDIDAARTAVIEAAEAYVDHWPSSNVHGPRNLANALDRLDALTTKGVTT